VTTMRTDEEILRRLGEIKGDDFFGAQSSELVSRLPFAIARPFLIDEATEAGWKTYGRDRDAIVGEMRGYMEFAVEKATGHRGLSASRSIEHFRSWVWLLSDEDFSAIDWEDYANYGAPILKAVANRFGIDLPDDPRLMRMAEGKICSPDCEGGCGR